jgi:hypothetical protein
VRILLDENVPHPLMRFLSGHEVSTVQGLGWRGILNGELLRIAEESFDVFILADKNMRYQQRMDGRQIAIIELPTNRWPLLQPLAPQITAAVQNAQVGEYIIVDLTS